LQTIADSIAARPDGLQLIHKARVTRQIERLPIADWRNTNEIQKSGSLLEKGHQKSKEKEKTTTVFLYPLCNRQSVLFRPYLYHFT